VNDAAQPYPSGWFVVAFSGEIPPMGVKSLRYFGEKLVAFRGEDGAVHVLDAYCAHMGADLASGGRVVGTSIECPFHAWRYCGTGECVSIPYAKKIPPKARQRAWTVREVNGLVLVHHDSQGAAPAYDIPTIEEFGGKLRTRAISAVEITEAAEKIGAHTPDHGVIGKVGQGVSNRRQLPIEQRDDA